MTIKKYLHSCILLEDKGKRLLIDPGLFSFVDKQVTPEDIGKVDAILITHDHADHYYPEALRAFVAMGSTRIVASADICALLAKENLPNEIIRANEEKEIAGFKVKAIEASHGPLPIPIPHNFAYLINDRLLHAGDSVTVDIDTVEILCLPTFAPWERALDAIDFVKRVKPKVVIPIHDWIIRDLVLERLYPHLYESILKKDGIVFKQLAIGEALEI